RCQRFDFSKVDAAKIQNHLLGIAEKEGFTLEPEAALKIAELADGGMRDSLSILEQARAYGAGEITEATIDSIFGLASSGEKIALLEDIFNGNLEGVLQRVESCETHGVDIRRLTEDLITALKDGLIFQYTNKEGLLHSLSRQHAETVSQRSASELLAMIEVLMKAQERYRSAQSVSSVFEIACLELIAGGGEEPQPVSPVRKTSARAKSEPAVTEPEPEEPAPNEQPAAPVVDVPQELSVDDVLALLVQCNKAEKQIAEEGLRALGAGPMMDRYTASLRQLDLKAAGKDVLLFTASEAVVHMVSEEAFNRELYTVLKSHTLDRMPFVITRGRYEEAVNAFRVRSKDHTLPEPKAIERWQELIQNDDQAERTEESVMNLFGKENVEVIDEGD
ncbi:MAG: hypothetical protein IKG37_10045, partial [Solobacterium sp.]|nr:hypothetical protein [Solobacterium sp.]